MLIIQESSLLKTKMTVNNILIEHIKEWDSLINALPYPVSIIDTEFNIVMANNEMSELLNISNSANIKCYHAFHKSEGPIEECPLLKTINSGKKEKAEIFEPTLNKLFIESTSPILIKDTIIGVIHSLIDVTEIKSSE